MKGKEERGRVIGLDMHPDSFSGAALPQGEAGVVKPEWLHDHVPQQDLESWLSKYVRVQDVIVIEASGNTFNTVDRIRASGCSAVVLEPVRASQIRKAYCTTDKVSAVKLARVYLSGLAMEVWTPDGKTRERREVLYAHRRAVQDSTRCRNRIRCWLSGFGIRKRKGLKLSDATGLEWSLAQREWSATQRFLMEVMFHDLWGAEQRRKLLKQLMAEEVSKDPELLQLVRLFGINAIGAYALGAAVGDIHRFRTPKKLVAYLGLSPRVNRSGITHKDGGSIRWGNTEIRRILIQAAQALLRYDAKTSLHGWALKLKYRKGTNLAAFAVARKLVVASWYVMKGIYVPVQDTTEHLKRKLEELGKIIGSDRVRNLGYLHTGDFRDKKLQIIMGDT